MTAGADPTGFRLPKDSVISTCVIKVPVYCVHVFLKYDRFVLIHLGLFEKKESEVTQIFLKKIL